MPLSGPIQPLDLLEDFGAGEGIRTLDPDLGKVARAIFRRDRVRRAFTPAPMLHHGANEAPFSRR
jgi:hypothetical protein